MANQLVTLEEKMTYYVVRFSNIISQISNSYILAPINIGYIFFH